MGAVDVNRLMRGSELPPGRLLTPRVLVQVKSNGFTQLATISILL